MVILLLHYLRIILGLLLPAPVALPDAVGYKVGPYLNGVKAPTSRVIIPLTH